MKAATQDQYGLNHVRFNETSKPDPGPGEVRVNVDVASINPADWHLATGTPMLLRLSEGVARPKQSPIGTDAAGTVDQVGPGVSNFQPGDNVFGTMAGAFAEFALAQVDRLARIPTGVSAETAAGLPIAGCTALQALEKGEVEGRSVVVVGASGGVGHYAIQLAQAMGAARVTGVCSGRNVDFVSTLGADHVIDYTTTDFTGTPHDVVVVCAGEHSSNELRRGLTVGGRAVLVGGKKGGRVLGPLPTMVTMASRFALASEKLSIFVADETPERLNRLAELASQHLLTTHVDQEFALADISEAYAYQATNRTRGKVLIRP